MTRRLDWKARLAFLLACGLATAACDKEDSGSATTGPGGGGGTTGGSGGSGAVGGETPLFRGTCASDDKVGFFQVQHERDYSVVSGEVKDGAVPANVLEKVGEEGDCVLWKRENPFCEPPCSPGQTCDHGGSCIPYPEVKNVGTVTVDGLEKAVRMEPPSYFETSMPHPAFSPGSAITLRASGGDYEPFTLFGEGSAPIAIPDDTWVVEKGQPLTMSWTPDESAAHARVFIRLNIDQHGNSPVELHCDVEDTGSATLPASLLDQLRGSGVSGFPSGNIARRTADSIEIEPGCVEFVVFSHLVGNLEVAGHIPCNGPDDCPDPMTCDLDTHTCV